MAFNFHLWREWRTQSGKLVTAITVAGALSVGGLLWYQRPEPVYIQAADEAEIMAAFLERATVKGKPGLLVYTETVTTNPYGKEIDWVLDWQNRFVVSSTNAPEFGMVLTNAIGHYPRDPRLFLGPISPYAHPVLDDPLYRLASGYENVPNCYAPLWLKPGIDVEDDEFNWRNSYTDSEWWCDTVGTNLTRRYGLEPGGYSVMPYTRTNAPPYAATNMYRQYGAVLSLLKTTFNYATVLPSNYYWVAASPPISVDIPSGANSEQVREAFLTSAKTAIYLINNELTLMHEDDMDNWPEPARPRPPEIGHDSVLWIHGWEKNGVKYYTAFEVHRAYYWCTGKLTPTLNGDLKLYRAGHSYPRPPPMPYPRLLPVYMDPPATTNTQATILSQGSITNYIAGDSLLVAPLIEPPQYDTTVAAALLEEYVLNGSALPQYGSLTIFIGLEDAFFVIDWDFQHCTNTNAFW